MSISVNWGDGGKSESVRFEENDPRLPSFLRNAVDPKRHPEKSQIFGIDDLFHRVFKTGKIKNKFVYTKEQSRVIGQEQLCPKIMKKVK